MVAGGQAHAGRLLSVASGYVAVFPQGHTGKAHGPAVAEVAAGLVVGVVESLQVQGAGGHLCHKVGEADVHVSHFQPGIHGKGEGCGLPVAGFVFCLHHYLVSAVGKGGGVDGRNGGVLYFFGSGLYDFPAFLPFGDDGYPVFLQGGLVADASCQV